DDNLYSNDPLEPTAIKSTVLLRTTGQLDTNIAVREINGYIAANFPKNIRVTVGGAALVEGSTNRHVVNSVWVSITIAFIALFFIVSFFNRSFFSGLIGVIPLIALVLLNFAVMGFLRIKLNIATAMIASVSMGIGIDYTVHFMEAYKREAAAANYTGSIFLTSTAQAA
ncbi:MAG: RND family transporter, partial [Spirochaetaceae bacterium]|nr:RND family transporter [Spirochaetaceae bacterium]